MKKSSLVVLPVAGVLALTGCQPMPTGETGSGAAPTSTVTASPAPSATSNPAPTAFGAAVPLTSIASQTDAAGTVPRNRMTLRGTKVYSISEGTAEVHAVDLLDEGREMWAYTLPDTGPGPLVAQVEEAGPGRPVVSKDGKVVYGAAFSAKTRADGMPPQVISIAALDAETGKPLWQRTLQVPIMFNHSDQEKTPERAYRFKVDLGLASDGTLIVNGKYVSLGLDPATGDELWRTDENAMALVDDAGKTYRFTLSGGGSVSEMDPRNGRPTKGLVMGVSEVNVVRNTPDGAILAYTMPSTGYSVTLMKGNVPLAQFMKGTSCPFQPGTGGIVCLGADGTTTFTDEKSGNKLAELPADKGLSAPVVFGGLVYGAQGGKGVVMTTAGANPVAVDFIPTNVNEYGALGVVKREVSWHPVK